MSACQKNNKLSGTSQGQPFGSTKNRWHEVEGYELIDVYENQTMATAAND